MEIIKSRNYNAKKYLNRTSKTVVIPQKWDIIVNHITEGYMPGTLDWLTNPDSLVSIHFLVTRDGKIYQQTDLQHGAWHVVKNRPSIAAARNRVVPANLYTVGIEHEGKSAETKGRLTDAQYKASLWLHQHIIMEYEKINKEPFQIDRDHIVGHYQFATVNRSASDPGTEFPFEKLMADLLAWDKSRKAKQDPVNGPYVNEKGEKLYFRVIVGSHPTRAMANAAMERLKDEGHKDAWLQAVYVKID